MDGIKQGISAMQGQKHIIVVDDEPGIRETIQEYLELHDFRVTTAGGGEELRQVIGDNDADLVLLDIRMPGEDGLSLARYLRAEKQVGIIMLTAAGEVVDRIVGLEMGADDYLAKPVDLRELLARIKAVLRRSGRVQAGDEAAAPDSASLARFGSFTLNLESHKLFDPEGGEVPLTGMEFDLLKAFADNPNRVLTRDQLLNLAHNRDWEPFDRSIDIRIARIRRKIESDPAKPQVIKTVRGAGYIYSTAKG
jgi:two-component system phosphate regulon response regulator OmpR